MTGLYFFTTIAFLIVLYVGIGCSRKSMMKRTRAYLKKMRIYTKHINKKSGDEYYRSYRSY